MAFSFVLHRIHLACVTLRGQLFNHSTKNGKPQNLHQSLAHVLSIDVHLLPESALVLRPVILEFNYIKVKLLRKPHSANRKQSKIISDSGTLPVYERERVCQYFQTLFISKGKSHQDVSKVLVTLFIINGRGHHS